MSAFSGSLVSLLSRPIRTPKYDWLWYLFTNHLFSKQWSIWIEGLVIAQRKKKYSPHSEETFLQVPKFTLISVPGVACFKAFLWVCVSLTSEVLRAEDLFCFLPLEHRHWCKLLMFAVIFRSSALNLLQCLAHCSEKWLK